MTTTLPKTEFASRARLQELLRAPRLPIDVDALQWLDLAPGVRIHTLEVVPSGFPKRALLRIEAGAEVPQHSHDIMEDLLMLEGSLELTGDGDGVYTAGAVFRSRPGTAHLARNTSDAPCLCYVVYWPPPGY